MNIFNGNSIRKKQHIILILLYMFRGVTNDQLRRRLYSHLTSKPATQLTYVSRFIAELKELKIVKSISCHPYSKEELNFLTRKGIEYIHENCRIEKEQFDKEIGFNIDGPFGNFDYDILSPPLHFIEHHLMLVDVMVDYRRFGEFRHNLHCVKKYEYVDDRYVYRRKAKLKPDAELLSIKGYLLAVEIDTGTERYNKLLEKFKNYRRYFDYCIENDIEIPWRAIVFHTKRGNEQVTLEEDQRWQTILKAASEGLEYYCWRLNILGFNREPFIKMIKEDSERLTALGINIPTKVNPILEKKKEREENKRKEELRKQRELEDFKREKKEKDERLRIQQLEIKRQQESTQRIVEEIRLEEEKKKKGVLGWFR